MNENKKRNFECKECEHNCKVEIMYGTESCPLNLLEFINWLKTKWNEVENEERFIGEFERVLEKAKLIKDKFGTDFALGWYLGKMITSNNLRIKKND